MFIVKNLKCCVFVIGIQICYAKIVFSFMYQSVIVIINMTLTRAQFFSKPSPWLLQHEKHSSVGAHHFRPSLSSQFQYRTVSDPESATCNWLYLSDHKKNTISHNKYTACLLQSLGCYLDTWAAYTLKMNNALAIL